VDAERLARENRRLARLLKAANLRVPSAQLAEVDFNPARRLDRAQIGRLSSCAWVRGNRNLFITGPCGTGKSYLASAFGNAAVRQGMTVRCERMSLLLDGLTVARADGTLHKLLLSLKTPDLLILDDFGIARLDMLRCRDIFDVVDNRYDRGAIVITAQLPVREWHGVFDDATIADAVLDRILHNSDRIELHGASMRRSAAKDDSTQSPGSDL